jgi:teichuronic acid biosynthesis glycosyltransferase TuaG
VNDMKSVSVVIPTWNRSALLERAIRSSLHQTHPPLEVLVCDDGSTDDAEQVVRSIGDSRVIWLPGERAGRPSVPRNRGIRASAGEWIAFLDDDDVWLPEKLEVQVREAESRRIAAVCSDAWRIRQETEDVKSLIGGATTRLSFNDLLAENRVICSSMLVRRELVLNTGGFPEDRELTAVEDYALWLRVADQVEIAYLALPLLNYSDYPHSSIRRHGPAKSRQRELVFKDFLNWKQMSNDWWHSGNYWRVRLRLLTGGAS